MEKDKIDVSLLLTKQMDFPRGEEYGKLLKDFAQTERLVHFSAQANQMDLNGFMSYGVAEELDFDFDSLEEMLERLIEEEVIRNSSVYLVDGLAIRITKK